jgi:hypothetical protein
MAARLKVFVTSDGLTDYVVAVSSKAKALAAWGSHQDLFKTGAAHETDDPDLVAAAAAQPGQVLRRPAGTREKLARLKPKAPGAPKGPSKAALRKVADLEARLEALAAAEAQTLHRLEAQREKLEREIAAAAADHAAQRERLEVALTAARQALG